ncbi:unnamed protein product, partial [marine sediment metagenome]
GAIGMVTVSIHYGKALHSPLLERGYSQGGTIKVAHPPVKVSAGMMVTKAGKNKGIVYFSLMDFICRLKSASG